MVGGGGTTATTTGSDGSAPRRKTPCSPCRTSCRPVWPSTEPTAARLPPSKPFPAFGSRVARSDLLDVIPAPSTNPRCSRVSASRSESTCATGSRPPRTLGRVATRRLGGENDVGKVGRRKVDHRAGPRGSDGPAWWARPAPRLVRATVPPTPGRGAPVLPGAHRPRAWPAPLFLSESRATRRPCPFPRPLAR